MDEAVVASLQNYNNTRDCAK